MRHTVKAVFGISICCLLLCMMFLIGCAAPEKNKEDEVASLASQVQDKKLPPLDYMVLVNKQHRLPEDWEGKLETTTVKNSLGDDVEVEKKAYDAYILLKEDLSADGIQVDLDSARRSVSDQQRIWDEFTVQYGEAYTKSHVAVPGYSEHQTGLALDLYLIIDGKEIVENEDMMTHPDVWTKIHSKLADHGFILRYLEEADDITGYAYEPWHIRYIGDLYMAKEITDRKITLEEYLGVAEEAKAANAKLKAEEEAAAEETRKAEKAAASQSAPMAQASYDSTGLDSGYDSQSYAGDGIYHAEYNEMYNSDGPSHSMPGWHDGYLETYYNASAHYLSSTWTLDDEGFYHDENGRYVVGVDISHADEMPYGTIVETGKGEGVVYDYGSGAEVHDFATNW